MNTSISAEIVGGSSEGLTGNMSEAAITEFHRQKTGGQFRPENRAKKPDLPQIDFFNLKPANISNPVQTAFMIDGVEYRMDEIEPYIKEGFLELNNRTNQYEWVHREPA